MDFSLFPELRALRDRTRDFIAGQVIPLEKDERRSSHDPGEALRRESVGRARAALLTPYASREMGGLGLSHIAKVVCSEAPWRVGDRSVQILGGQGVTNESPVMRIFTDMRAEKAQAEVHA